MEKLKELEAKTEEELHNITILAYQVITKSSLFILLDLLTDNKMRPMSLVSSTEYHQPFPSFERARCKREKLFQIFTK